MTLRLNGSTSGYVEIDAPAVAGSTSITLPATSGGEFVVSDSNGRVGIGTGSADELLHVELASTDTASIKLENTDGFHIFKENNGNLTIADAVSDRVRLDSSGRLLVGTFTSINNGNLQVSSQLDLFRSTDSTTAGQSVGVITFGDSRPGVYASIQGLSDGTPGSNDYPGRLIFNTTADGASSPTEQLRIDRAGNLFSARTYVSTTANAANIYVQSDGRFYRSTSSVKYKIDVETLEDQYADALLNCRPVWYRSTCETDNPNFGWWGFVAEEVAEIDPRLVFWKTTESVVQDDGSRIDVPCDPEPEGVAYDRFVPHLLNLIKRQKEQIETLEAANAAIETRLTALEGGTNP